MINRKMKYSGQMKKVLLTLLVALVCQAGWSQSADAVIDRHKADKGAQYSQMDKEMIRQIMTFMPSINEEMKEAKKMLEKVDCINTIILS